MGTKTKYIFFLLYITILHPSTLILEDCQRKLLSPEMSYPSQQVFNKRPKDIIVTKVLRSNLTPDIQILKVDLLMY